MLLMTIFFHVMMFAGAVALILFSFLVLAPLCVSIVVSILYCDNFFYVLRNEYRFLSDVLDEFIWGE